MRKTPFTGLRKAISRVAEELIFRVTTVDFELTLTDGAAVSRRRRFMARLTKPFRSVAERVLGAFLVIDPEEEAEMERFLVQLRLIAHRHPEILPSLIDPQMAPRALPPLPDEDIAVMKAGSKAYWTLHPETPDQQAARVERLRIGVMERIAARNA